MPDYRAIFEAVEFTLIREGSHILPQDQLRCRLGRFKQVEGRRFSSAQVYRLLVEIAFYFGFRAATVTEKLEVNHRHFPGYDTIRYIDIVFVAYGQAQSIEFGLPAGICLPRNPGCAVCGVRGYCNHDSQRDR